MPVGTEACRHQQPRTIEERISIAKEYLVRTAQADEGAAEHTAIPLLVDGMDNDFSSTYSAWPERFVVLEERLPEAAASSSSAGDWSVAFLSEPYPDGGHKMDDLCAWLDARTAHDAADCIASA